MKHATDEDLAKSKAQAGLQHATEARDDDSISTKQTLDEGVAEAKDDEPQQKKKRRSWFGSRGSRPSTSESRPGTGDKPKRRSFLSRFSRGSRASTPGDDDQRPRSREEDDTHTYTETVDDTLFDETTLDTEAYELRERDRKRAKKAIKDAREWLKDPTPLWARCTNWRLMLKGPLKEPLALPTKGDDRRGNQSSGHETHRLISTQTRPTSPSSTRNRLKRSRASDHSSRMWSRF